MYRQAGNLGLLKHIDIPDYCTLIAATEYASADAVNMVVTVARARQLESLVGYQVDAICFSSVTRAC